MLTNEKTHMAWRVARSLLALRDQINAAFPNRNKASDGTIGDANHDSTSDHTPWYGPGIVTALDITHDPANGMDIDKFTDQLAASRDPRIKYLIANWLILDSRPQFNPWKWVRYTGPNPHASHVHISVMDSPLCDDPRPWNIPMLGGATPPPSYPTFPLQRHEYFGDIDGPRESHGGAPVSRGGIPNEAYYVKLIQQRMQQLGYAPNHAGWADGVYQRETTNAVAAWQRAKVPGTTRFGEVWWDDWGVLFR